MNRRIFTVVSAVVMATMSVFSATFPDQVMWNKNVTEGYIGDPANWGDGTAVPSNEYQTAVFDIGGQSVDYVFKVGAGTNLVTRGNVWCYNFSANNSMTFDIEGNWLVDSARWCSDWQGFLFSTGANTAHFYNFEGLSTGTAYPLVEMNNVFFKVGYDGSKGRYYEELSRGTYNTWNPGGKSSNNHQIMLGGSQAANDFLMKGGRLIANNVYLRGGNIYVTGGVFEPRGLLLIGQGNNGRSTLFDVSDGTLAASNQVAVGCAKDLAMDKSVRLVIRGQGRFIQNHSADTKTGYYQGAGTNLNDDVSITFMDDSVSDIGNVQIGHMDHTRSFIVVTNQAEVSFGAIDVGSNSYTTNNLAITDHANVTLRSSLNVGNNSTSESKAIIDQDAVVTRTGGDICIGHSECDSELKITGNARLTSAYDTLRSVNVRTGGRFVVDGSAQIALTNDQLMVGASLGSGALAEIRGGTSCFGRCVYVTGFNANTETNILRVSGGHITTQTGDNKSSLNICGLRIGATGARSLYEQTGGVADFERLALVGIDTTGDGCAVLRISGGEFNMKPYPGSSEYEINVADGKTSKGRVELLGGIVNARELRGWTGSRAKGGSGWAALYADGGRVRLDGSSPVYNFDEAVLGEKGLILECHNNAKWVYQAFTDASASVTGRLIKIGPNDLIIQKNSTHGETVIADGRAYPATASITQYGRSLVITNGASFSIAGTPTSFTCEQLTLGDSTSRGYLCLDVGDVFTLTGENALKVGNGYIRCSTALTEKGEWTFFDLGENATVDPAELAKLKVFGANGEYEYVFSVADGHIKLTVRDRDLTGSTWTGEVSSAWNLADNWTAGVPLVNTVATLPLSAARKSITLAADSAADTLSVDGEYTVSGGDLAARVFDVAANGQIDVGTPLKTHPSDTVTKKGSGELDLNVASPSLESNWEFEGGRTVFSSLAAVGSASADCASLTFGPATVEFEGGGTLHRLSYLDAGASRVAIVKTDADVVLEGAVHADSGGFAKFGAGSLTLSATDGTHVLAVDKMGVGDNQPPIAEITLSPSGDAAPAQTTENRATFGGVSVIEGKLRLQGTGKNTIFQSRQYSLIGGNYNATVNAEIEVANCTWQQGYSGQHLVLGGICPASTQATHPTLRIIEGAVVTADGLFFGRLGHTGGTLDIYPTLAITNGSFACSWALASRQDDAHVFPTLRIGAGGVAESSSTNAGNGETLAVGRNADYEVADGGILRSKTPTKGLLLDNNTSGELRLLRGGILEAPCIASANGIDRLFEIISDGGKMIFKGGETSVVHNASSRYVRLKGDGLEFNVASGEHDFMMLMTGEGNLVKSGAGTLVFHERAQGKLGSITACDDKVTCDITGTVSVAAGKIRFESADTFGDNVSFAGAGTVDFNGAALSGRTIVFDPAAPTALIIENATLGTIRVDFGVAGDDTPLEIGTQYIVANIGTGTTLDISKWRARNIGVDRSIRFTLVDGQVVATVARKVGTMLIMH